MSKGVANTFQPAKKIYKKQSAECKVAYGIRELHATPIMNDSTGTQLQENLNENQKMKVNFKISFTTRYPGQQGQFKHTILRPI